MKAVDIEWDVDCQEDLEDLPTEIKIPEGLEDEEDISDYISDITGFCHKGFRLVENEKDKIVLDFGNIVSELETKNLKLLKVKDNNGLFVVDLEGNLYGIESYYHGGYLDRFIGEKFVISFERMEQPTRDFEDWRKEFMDASWVKSFIEHIVKKEYPNFKETSIEDDHLELIRDNVKVEWENIGEGYYGDYNPDNPNDVELLRFYVSVLRDGVWEEKEDASYCTFFPASASYEEKMAGLEILLNRFYDALNDDVDISVKKLGESLSWISLESVATKKASLSEKIQSAEIRATELQPTLNRKFKESEPEI